MIERTLQCFAFGRPGNIQALCVDLDIAVEAPDVLEVQTRMHEAIVDYVRAACAEAPDVRDRLLNRRAPWFVRLKLAVGYFAHTMRNGSHQRDEVRAGFDIACPA